MSNIAGVGSCPYCSTQWSFSYHPLGQCPNVEAVEYHRDGSVARVVFRRERVTHTRENENPHA